MIRTIIFDLGGVIITLDQPQAVRRFKEIGLTDADKRLDPYTQSGLFGDLERGKITAEDFRHEFSRLAGKEVTYEECRYGWLGYVGEVPQRNLNALRQLRAEGYRLVLLSNTNPYMMSWVNSSDFDGNGHSLEDYMDACYLSYQLGCMKPDEKFFKKVIETEQTSPSEMLFLDDGPRNIEAARKLGIQTLCPKNGEDWTEDLFKTLGKL